MPRHLPPWLPVRGLERVARRRTVERGASSLRAAYVRVGEAVGLDPKEVAACYRAHKRKEVPTVFTRAHADAMDMLDMPERALEERVRRLVAQANTMHPQIDGRPRFNRQHHWTSINSASGFPDDVILDRKQRCVYFFELKRESESPRPDQEAWLADLAAIDGHDDLIVLGVIRPSNYSTLYVALDVDKFSAHAV